MRAVDTNVLVRLLTRDDPKQAAVADDFVENGAWVSHLVLAEACWVLEAVYKLDRVRLATAVHMLLNHRSLVIQDSEVCSAALNHFKAHQRVGFSDCLILEIARKAGHVPVGTFDQVLSRLPNTQRIRS
ncbi:MAG: PIN domain-containing protein [Myxococcaceae bacterium]